MIELPAVQKYLAGLLERHRKSIDVFRERADFRDGVIYFDVSDLDLEGYNKFVPVFSVSRCSLFRRCKRLADAREGLGGNQSLERSFRRCEPRVALRKIRRRGTRPCRGHLLRSRRPRSRAPSGAGNCRHLASPSLEFPAADVSECSIPYISANHRTGWAQLLLVLQFTARGPVAQW